METVEVINIVSTLGFPIVMTLLLFNYIKNEAKQQVAAIEALKAVVEQTNILIERLNNVKE